MRNHISRGSAHRKIVKEAAKSALEIQVAASAAIQNLFNEEITTSIF